MACAYVMYIILGILMYIGNNFDFKCYNILLDLGIKFNPVGSKYNIIIETLRQCQFIKLGNYFKNKEPEYFSVSLRSNHFYLYQNMHIGGIDFYVIVCT